MQAGSQRLGRGKTEADAEMSISRSMGTARGDGIRLGCAGGAMGRYPRED